MKKRELRSRSHTRKNQELRSWSHVHGQKSSGAVSFLRRLRSPGYFAVNTTWCQNWDSNPCLHSKTRMLQGGVSSEVNQPTDWRGGIVP